MIYARLDIDVTDAKLALPQASNRVPLWLKLAYTAFMAVLVPVYWYYYGPTNFLYFCDLALLITLLGIWIESPRLVSMCAVGILAPQALWVADFLSTLGGLSLIGMTRLHVQQRELIVPARAVAISRLGAILACLSRLGAWIRPARITSVGRSRLGSAAGVLLLHAAPKSASRADTRQYQLRMGSVRLCCSELGFARRLAHRIDDRIALAAVRADPFSVAALRPQAGARA